MKYFFSIFFLLVFTNAFAQLTDTEIRDFKTGKVKKVDNSYVYWLPYKKNKRFLFVQGANSSFSHKNELSFDFKMKQGSSICAARGGVVLYTKMDSNKGGLNDAFLGDGNHIAIEHEDGSVAMYWHLKQNGVYVKPGNTVLKGQLIGASGNTGYTAFPHLHFQVVDKSGKEILPRFYTKKGALYLRPGRWYKCKN